MPHRELKTAFNNAPGKSSLIQWLILNAMTVSINSFISRTNGVQKSQLLFSSSIAQSTPVNAAVAEYSGLVGVAIRKVGPVGPARREAEPEEYVFEETAPNFLALVFAFLRSCLIRASSPSNTDNFLALLLTLMPWSTPCISASTRVPTSPWISGRSCCIFALCPCSWTFPLLFPPSGKTRLPMAHYSSPHALLSPYHSDWAPYSVPSWRSASPHRARGCLLSLKVNPCVVLVLSHLWCSLFSSCLFDLLC